MADVTDADVREALRELGAELQTIERWVLDGKEVAKGFFDDGTWWSVRDCDARTEGEAPDALAAVLRIRAALDMRPPEPRAPKPPTPPTREQVIAHLRSLSAEGLLELLREARVCVGWEDYDDEGVQTDDEIELSQLHTMCSRTVAFCRPDFCTPGWWWRLSTPDGSPGPHGLVRDLPTARGAAEDAAIAAGYRVPWRQT